MDNIPSEIKGWKSEEDVKTYSRETIFDYIDGAGEVYRQYRFRELKVYRFSKMNEPDLILELFDMGSPEDAYGVFTHGRAGDGIGVGQDSEYRPGWLCFWEGNYFVCAYAEGESQVASDTVIDLGRAVASAIQDPGRRPEVVGYLPREGLVEKSLRFFHTPASLNYHYFLSEANILKLSEKTDAVLAKYIEPDGPSILLLVCYEDGAQAQTAFRGFLDAYMPEARQTHIHETENGTWMAAKTKDAIVVIVLEAPDKEVAERLLRAVAIMD